MDKIKVVIAEDDEILNEIITENFEDAGFECFSFLDGLQTWEFLQTNQVDAVLTDIKMPFMDGIELLKKIRQRDAFKPIVLIASAHPDLEEGQDFNSLGALEFFKKPYDFDLVIEFIKSNV